MSDYAIARQELTLLELRLALNSAERKHIGALQRGIEAEIAFDQASEAKDHEGMQTAKNALRDAVSDMRIAEKEMNNIRIQINTETYELDQAIALAALPSDLRKQLGAPTIINFSGGVQGLCFPRLP